MQFITSGGDQHLRALWFHGTGESQMNSMPDFTLGSNQSTWINLVIRWDKDTDSGRLSYKSTKMSDWELATTSSHNHTSAIPALGGTDAYQKCVFGAYHLEGIGQLQLFDGKMADIALWDSRLSDEEADMYFAGISATGIANSNLKHFWTCSGDGEDHGTASTRDEADSTAINGASFEALP